VQGSGPIDKRRVVMIEPEQEAATLSGDEPTTSSRHLFTETRSKTEISQRSKEEENRTTVAPPFKGQGKKGGDKEYYSQSLQGVISSNIVTFILSVLW